MIKGVTETVKIEVNKQKVGFLGKLEVELVASLLGNMLSRKDVLKAVKEQLGLLRIFNTTSPLTNFEIRKYCES